MGAFELAMTPVGAIVFNFQDLLFMDWVPIRRRIYFVRKFSYRGYVMGVPSNFGYLALFSLVTSGFHSVNASGGDSSLTKGTVEPVWTGQPNAG